MKKLAVLVLLVASCGGKLFAQDMEAEPKQNLLEISAGYCSALPPFSNASTSATFLKPRSGGSMSFSYARLITDEWGAQVEVLTSAFKVKTSDLASEVKGGAVSQVSIDPYRSTFFGAGAVAFLPIAGLTLGVKGSVGVNVVEFATQDFSFKSNQTGSPMQSVTVSAKRSVAPGALLGVRFRYPVGESVYVGAKVEYGISYADFTNVKYQVNALPSNPDPLTLENFRKTLSYLNAGVVLGLRF